MLDQGSARLCNLTLNKLPPRLQTGYNRSNWRMCLWILTTTPTPTP
jgi:hypothetical protein